MVGQENGWPLEIDFAELSLRVRGLRDMIRRVMIHNIELEQTPVWKMFRIDCPDIAKFARSQELQAHNLPKARPG